MQLHIISPRERQSHTITWLDLQTPAGGFVVQPGHAPTVCALKPQSSFTFCLENGVQKSISINHALVEIDRHQVIIIMNEHEQNQ